MSDVKVGAKVAPKVPEKKGSKGRVEVGIDTDPKTVIELDSAGYTLSFACEVGKFLQLEDAVVHELGYENRVAYGIAQGLWKNLVKDKDRPVGSIEVLPPLAASAGRRLEVTGAPKGWHYVWVRPDEIQARAGVGYSMAGSEVQTLYWDGSVHKVGAFGQSELVLMKIPVEKYEASEKENGARSRSRIEGQTAQAEEAIRRVGGVPFEPSDKDGRAWKEDEEGMRDGQSQ